MGAARASVSPEAAKDWRLLTARIAQETDERTRRNLEIVAHHVESEYIGDIAAVMATFAPDPQHQYFGAAQASSLVGAAAVQASYVQEIMEGRRHLFEFARIVADHTSVVLEGTMRITAPGNQVVATFSVNASDVDTSEWYILEYPALVVLPISPDGLIEAERVYFGALPRVTGVLGPAERAYLGPNLDPVNLGNGVRRVDE